MASKTLGLALLASLVGTIGCKAALAAKTDFSAQAYFSSEYYPKNSKWFTAPWPESEIRYRLAPQAALPITKPDNADALTIEVDASKTYQSVTGIGTSLDESSCYALQKNHSDAQIKAILRQFIDPKIGMGLNLFRICFGTSDFSDARGVSKNPNGWYSYQDEKEGPFSIENDRKLGIIRVIKLAQEVARESATSIHFFASAWSPPAWMKSSNNLVGGKLLPEMNAAYAKYLRQAVQAYQVEGVPIEAITTNNEHYVTPDKYPGCFFDEWQEAKFVEEIGTQFRAHNLKTQIWILDHNFDLWKPAKTTLDELKKNTPNGEGYALASAVAFHHYGGVPADMSKLHDAYPDKDIQFSEGSVWGTSGMDEIAQIFRNWSKSYMNWVPMVTQTPSEHIQGPYNTPGALSPTILVAKDGDKGEWYRTPEFYLLSQFSRFIRPGAVRIDSSAGSAATLTNVAFKNPDGEIAVVVINQNEWKQNFKILCAGNQIFAAIPASSVATYIFPSELKTSGLAPVAPPQVLGPQNPAAGNGQITKEWWLNVKDGLKGLAVDPRFPDQPNGTRVLNETITSDRQENIKSDAVTRLRGYVLPNTSGNFTFEIAADGYGELWLSSDENPAHKQLICKSPGWAMVKEFGKYPEQTSPPIALQAGHKYYIEALQQGGGGNGNIGVAWNLPGLGNQKIIAGSFLSDH